AEEAQRVREMRDAIDRTERDAAEARKREEDERRRHDEETKRKAELISKKRLEEPEIKTKARVAALRAQVEAEEDEAPRSRRPGAVVRPAATPKLAPRPGSAEKRRARLT